MQTSENQAGWKLKAVLMKDQKSKSKTRATKGRQKWVNKTDVVQKQKNKNKVQARVTWGIRKQNAGKQDGKTRQEAQDRDRRTNKDWGENSQGVIN